MMTDERLDAGAENCGRLIGLVATAVARLAAGQTLGVVAYAPDAQVDLWAWCRMTGHQLLVARPVADHWEFVIQSVSNEREGISDGTRHDPQHTRER